MSDVKTAVDNDRPTKEVKKLETAQDELMQNIFHDMYRDRKKIYHLNFMRGIMFGVGSAIGGTIVIALVVWSLSFFINVPVIGDYVYEILQVVEQRQ